MLWLFWIDTLAMINDILFFVSKLGSVGRGIGVDRGGVFLVSFFVGKIPQNRILNESQRLILSLNTLARRQ